MIQCRYTSDWMIHSPVLMEKNMSKSNDSSKLGSAPQVRELRDDELENVSGGSCCNGQHIGIMVTKPTDVSSYSLGASNPTTIGT